MAGNISGFPSLPSAFYLYNYVPTSPSPPDKQRFGVTVAMAIETCRIGTFSLLLHLLIFNEPCARVRRAVAAGNTHLWTKDFVTIYAHSGGAGDSPKRSLPSSSAPRAARSSLAWSMGGAGRASRLLSPCTSCSARMPLSSFRRSLQRSNTGSWRAHMTFTNACKVIVLRQRR